MALTVIQRPEEDLYVEENPTVYDVPYFTSRWNAANLPLTYKITNTRFPINTEDIIEDILTISNNAGFAELGLDAATYTFFEKGSIKITNTTNYNGVWKIKQVIDPDTIVINAPFVADETGNVQNYYDNYNVLVKVYAGLPEYHPSNPSKPMELITDNAITITPQLNNEAVIDVAALVKSKLSLTNDYDVNDLNQFTALFISYAEQYDVSNGITVDVFTSTFIDDEIEGCDSSGSNFVINGQFLDTLSPWVNEGDGEEWVHNDVTDVARVFLIIPGSKSKILKQSSLSLNTGTEYRVDFDINISGSNQGIVTVLIGNEVIYQSVFSDSNSISFDFVYSGSTDNIAFEVELLSSPISSITIDLDNVSVVNILANPCLAYIFATHSALQPQSKYGANLGEYVQNFNGGVFENKWLTLMQQPVLFKGNYFDLSTLIPQSVIQSAIQSGGYFLEVIEFDRNNEVVAENQYPITENLGDGIYRFRLDDKTFQDSTKQFTAQILRIPVNLFVDGNQGTFDVTADPTGNPPSDWNLEKDARSIINFEDTDVYEGTGALSFESRSIFNDSYGLRFTDQGIVGNLNAQRITVTDFTDLDFTGDFAFEFRHRLDSFDGSFPVMFDIRFIESNDYIIRIYYKSATRITFQWIFAASPNQFREVQIDITTGQFNHFVFSWENGVAAKIFCNGVKVENNTDISIAGSKIIDRFNIFSGNDSNVYNANGYARGFRVFCGTPISDLQAASLYNSSTKNIQSVPAPLLPFLVREFRLNQEQGRTVNELNGFDEELSNVPGFRNDDVKFNGGVWVDTTSIT